MPDIDWVSLTSTNDDYSAFIRYSSEKHLTQKVLLPTRGNNILDLVFTREVDISSLSIVPPFFGVIITASLLFYKVLFPELRLRDAETMLKQIGI